MTEVASDLMRELSQMMRRQDQAHREVETTAAHIERLVASICRDHATIVRLLVNQYQSVRAEENEARPMSQRMFAQMIGVNPKTVRAAVVHGLLLPPAVLPDGHVMAREAVAQLAGREDRLDVKIVQIARAYVRRSSIGLGLDPDTAVEALSVPTEPAAPPPKRATPAKAAVPPIAPVPVAAPVPAPEPEPEPLVSPAVLEPLPLAAVANGHDQQPEPVPEKPRPDELPAGEYEIPMGGEPSPAVPETPSEPMVEQAPHVKVAPAKHVTRARGTSPLFVTPPEVPRHTTPLPTIPPLTMPQPAELAPATEMDAVSYLRRLGCEVVPQRGGQYRVDRETITAGKMILRAQSTFDRNARMREVARR